MKERFIPIILSLILLIGCNKEIVTKTDPAKTNTLEQVQKSKEKIDLNTASIDASLMEISDENSSIKNFTAMIEQLIPTESAQKIGPYISNLNKSSENIKEEANKISKANSELKLVSPTLAQSVIQIQQSDKTMDKVVSERDAAFAARDKAIMEKNSQMQKILNWLIITCIVGASLGLFFFLWLKSVYGLIGSGCFLLTMVMAITISAYMKYIALFGLFIGLILVGILIWQIWIRNKAVAELVSTVEVTKDNMVPESKDKLFGKNNETGIMDKIQSKTTMDFVQKEKQKISYLWDYSKNYKVNPITTPCTTTTTETVPGNSSVETSTTTTVTENAPTINPNVVAEQLKMDVPQSTQ